MTQAAQLHRTPTPDATLPDLPSDLDAPRTKLVYLSLLTADRATIGELSDRLDERKLALYPVLSDLHDRGLVTRDGETFAATR